MGAALVRSAFSANIKERRDCSTALFDENGRMVAQAEHIPVHLGAMPDAVAAVMSHNPGRNDVFILNDPFAGGTHLPDITLVSRTDVGFAVTRAHHADVGGVEPGSMPAASRTLEEEGVVIAPTPTRSRDARRARGADAEPRRAHGRLPRTARRSPPRRRAGRRALLAARPRRRPRRDGRAPRLLGADRPRRDRPTSRRTLRGERRARGHRRDAHDPRRRHRRRRRARGRLRRHGPTARRQPQLPALGHPVGGVLRRALPDGTGRACLRRSLRARHRRRAARLARQRSPRSCGRGRQRRDLVSDRRRALPRARPGCSRCPPRGRGR